ncbi:MAG: hypothetical protein ACQEP1_00815 [Nanobdellota archaeon]
MRHSIRYFFVLVIFVLVAGSATAVDVIGNDNLSYKRINFVGCGEENFVYCDGEKIETDSYEWKDCKITSFDPYECNSLSLASEDSKEMDLTRVIVRPDMVLDDQGWDGGFDGPVETARALWLLSEFGDKYENEMNNALDWLTRNRDNTEKCWPSGECKVEVTAKVMMYLTRAGFDDSERIFYDGMVWLENRQNFIGGDWNIYAEAEDGSASCNITLPGNKIELSLDGSGESRGISPGYGDTFNITCEDEAKIDVRDNRNVSVFRVTTNDEFDFTLPEGACWSETKWIGCDNDITVFGAIADLTEEHKGEARDYLSGELNDDDYTGEFLTSYDHIAMTALYYDYIDDKESIARYLVFKQNNDGSFGSEKGRLVRTMRVVKALQDTELGFVGNAVSDAKGWIYGKLEDGGFSSVLKDVLSFYSLYDDQEQALSNDLLKLEKDSDVTIRNPTHYTMEDLEFNVTGSLPVNISEFSDIGPYSEKKIQVKVNDPPAGRYYGKIRIHNDRNLTFIPVIVSVEPNVNLSMPEKVTMFGGKADLPIEVDSNGAFKCSIKGIEAEPFSIKRDTEKVTVDVSGSEERFSGEKDIVFDCGDIRMERKLDVDMYPSDSLEIDASDLNITTHDEEPKVNIKNNLDEPAELSLSIEGKAKALLYLEHMRKEVPAGEEVSFVIKNNLEKGMNSSMKGKLSIGVFGSTIKKDINIDISHVPFTETILFRILKYILYIGLLVGAFFVLHYYSEYLRLYTSRVLQKMKSVDIKEKAKALIPAKLRKKKKEEGKSGEDQQQQQNEQKKDSLKHSSMTDMINIMASVGKEDDEIRERLKKEGMSEEEINKALKVVSEERKNKQELDKEKTIIDVIKEMDQGSDEIKEHLKKAGFSDTDINEAFEEIEEEVKHKQKEFQEHLKEIKGDDGEPEEASLTDTASDNTGNSKK